MKRIHLSLLAGAAVLLAAASCAKTETIVDETPAVIGFKAVTNLATKADPELVGATLGTDNDYVIYAAASADGSPKYFDPAATSYGGQLFAYFTDGAKWFPASGTASYEKTPIYWPFGGVKVDFLAYALTPEAKLSLAPTFHDETHAREFTMDSWNTCDDQCAVMYAVANGCVPGASGEVNMTFKHAQALLAFTAKKSATTDVELKINKITVKGLEYEGNLKVDNYRAQLKVGWTITADGDKDLPEAVTFPYTLTNTAVKITDNLLIPEQDAKEIVINYSMGGKTFDYSLNIPRMHWEMGKKYTFNLEFSAAEITLNATVSDWTGVDDNEQIG